MQTGIILHRVTSHTCVTSVRVAKAHSCPRVPIPGKWDSTESLSQSLGNFPLLFPQPGASSRPCPTPAIPCSCWSCQKKAPNPGADERWRIQKQPKAPQCHSPAYLPSPKIPIFTQIRAERAATAEGGSTFILLLVAPGMGVGEQRRETALRESLGWGKQGKAPAKARSRGTASIVPPNPACSGQGGCVTAVPRGIHSHGLLGRGHWEGRGGLSPRCFPPWPQQRFLGAVPGDFVGAKRGNQAGQGEGMVLPRCWGFQGFSSRWASPTSASACG